jgi:hypothetical protein
MAITTMKPDFDWWALVPPFTGQASSNWPLLKATKTRNACLDQFFYDVGALTRVEVDFLVAATNREGSILVVFPKGARGDQGIVKYQDYETLRAAPGRLLSRFSIAGVGSSDLGAAAFARNLADHYGEPVGAIVAGYGLADLMKEGLGGWCFLGGHNRLMQHVHKWQAAGKLPIEQLTATQETLGSKDMKPARVITGSADTDALIRLLLDEDRRIQTLLGHSKGCLSIAAALAVLALGGARTAMDKARAIRVITTGAVVEMPKSFDNVVQFLGQLDWFGKMNSRPDKDYVSIPNAWHHTNLAIPFHMSIREVLARADQIPAGTQPASP